MSADKRDRLPPGWIDSTLGEFGTWASGGTPSRTNAEYYDGNIPWIKTGELNDGMISKAEEHLTESGLENSSAKLFPAGTLLMAMYGATIGKLGILDCPAATNQACAALLPRNETKQLIPFVFNYLRFCRDEFRSIGQGGAQPNISLTLIKSHPCPLPPLPEQRRIVAKIEALQARSDAAKQALDAIPPLLEKLRQSVLAAACGGKFTSDVTGGRLPSHWRMVPVEALVVPGGIFDGARDHGAQTAVAHNLRTIDYTTSGVRVVRLENLGHLAFNNNKHTFISQEKFEGLKQSEILEGDILIGSFIEDSVRVCLLPRLDTAAIAKADCFCVRVEPGAILREYLVLQLATRHTYNALTEKVRGVTRPRITTKHLRALEVPVCPLDEQAAIVKIVREQFALARTIEEHAHGAAAQAKALTQSILAKAFRGELVPQDPTDEPASVLLERIRAARETAAEPKRTGKRGRKPKAAQ